MVTKQSVVWFRRDLRLADNPAWAAGTATADRVTALYVLDPTLLASAGPFRRVQLLAHLHALDARLRRRGGRLLVRRGRPSEVVAQVTAEAGASVVHANADVTPYGRRRDLAVREGLESTFSTWWGNLVHPPGGVRTAKGRTSRVFTPFFGAWVQTALERWPEPGEATIAGDPGDGLPVCDTEPFQPGGEEEAISRLVAFSRRVDDYAQDRDVPARDGTSALSADLRFGTLAARTILATIGDSTHGRAAFIRQLAWRDWYAHLLWEEPSLADAALRPDLNRIDWDNDPHDIAAWQQGRTGYPIVDAGMRQLATTGWMHNRVRMIVASFLVKDLLVDWRIGERWFRRLLVDADIAQNAGNWQWVAGTGPDAAPYFRIFNPVRQSQKFDPTGAYIRQFVPELATVPTRWIHAPWMAPPLELASVGVALDDTYPYPIVDHAAARDRTLAAYAAAAATIAARR